MTNYQGNSNAAKEAQKKDIKPVVKKSGHVKKKSLLSKAMDMLIVEDAKDHVVEDLIIPTIQNTITSMAGYFFGGKKTSASTKTSYGKYYQEKDNRAVTRSGNRARSFTYDDILLDDRSEAEAVIDGMQEILSKYPVVSVADLYDLANISNDNWTANRYGWTDVRNARIIRTSDGYLLRMPKPMPID